MENENTITTAQTSSTALDIASRINALHEKAEALSKLAKDKAQEAIKVAIECGKLLVEQKKSLKYGDWIEWMESNCTFTRRTATNYIKLFTSVNTIEDGKPVSQVEGDSDVEVLSDEDSSTENFIEKLPAKTLKDAYIATGILPPRKEPELKQDDTPQSYRVEHVEYVDGFVKWYGKFKEKFPLDVMTKDTVDALLLDLSAIVRIYQELAQLKKDKFSN